MISTITQIVKNKITDCPCGPFCHSFAEHQKRQSILSATKKKHADNYIIDNHHFATVFYKKEVSMKYAKAILAGGNFWDMQNTFIRVSGIVSIQAGYTGGRVPNPTYMEVAGGRSGHAEAVELVFNPEQISYEQILDIFFSAHNPASLNRQGPDIGPQYRSAVFYFDNTQKQIALKKIAFLNASKKFAGPVVTEVNPAGPFYPAAPYHQHRQLHRGETSCRLS